TYLAETAPWNDMSRGVTHQLNGPDEQAKKIGLNPLSSGAKTEDEGLYPVQHGYWLQSMKAAVEAEAAEKNNA
ncbi:benzoate 1,2-dioxygenase large subunit, partial [Arthrobacter sp. SF27]|nr:benzoate 1,2-dioxygenase large subunit [Arthrobacter sp. SF27]